MFRGCSMRRLLLVPAVTVASIALAADSTGPFAQDFHKQVKKGSKEPNVIFSPASIARVLELAKAGARGATKDEIEKVTHGTPAVLADDALEVSNHMWVQSGYAVREEFKVDPLDFTSEPEKARATINEKVATETHERIKDLIPKG